MINTLFPSHPFFFFSSSGFPTSINKVMTKGHSLLLLFDGGWREIHFNGEVFGRTLYVKSQLRKEHHLALSTKNYTNDFKIIE